MATHDEPVDIAVDRDSISGTFITPGTLVPGVLFVHGWGGSQQQYLARAREVAALGCVCLTFDLRGHAQDREQYETVTREHNLRDVLAAYDMLAARRHVDPNAIAIIGSSYGGYLASVVTSMRPVKWLALRACQEFEGDVLLIESEFDDIIPRTVFTSYREACKHARSLTYRCVQGADHGLTEPADQRAYTALLVAWLTEMVFGARAGNAAARGRETVSDGAKPETPPEAA